MKNIEINPLLCVGCKSCVDSCPFNAISVDAEKAHINLGKCIKCGNCLNYCKYEAIIETENSEENYLNNEGKGICIFAEHRNGVFLNVVYELIGCAKRLDQTLQQGVFAVLVGDKLEDLADELIRYGVDCVWRRTDPTLSDFSEDIQASTVAEIIKRKKPAIFLGGATHSGRSLLPRVAALLETGLTADCTALSIEDDLLVQTRPTYGGGLMATIVTRNHRPQMASVRPRIMSRAQPVINPQGLVEELKGIQLKPSKIKVIEFQPENLDPTGLDEASVILAVGKGVVSTEKIEQIKRISTLVSGKIACSRMVVDEGWLPHCYQVGQSGRSVAPELYITFGISGANQHTAGIMQAKNVIAVNNDSEAPIFQMADYGVVADAGSILNILESELKAKS